MMRIRQGISVLEMVIVMGISSVALISSMRLLQTTMTEQKKASMERDVHIAVGRLSRQFRQDVHAAHDASIKKTDGRATSLLLTHTNGNTVYSIRDSTLLRVHELADQPIHREEFSLPDHFRVELEFDESSRRAMLQVMMRVFRQKLEMQEDSTADIRNEEIHAKLIANVQAYLAGNQRYANATPNEVFAPKELD